MASRKTTKRISTSKSKLRFGNQWSRRRLVVFAIAFAIVGVIALKLSLAAPPSTGLRLTYEQDNISTFTNLKCYHEDSLHVRTWEGSLATGESFNSTLPFCNSQTDGVSPGGTGFRLTAGSNSAAFKLVAVSPSGRVYEARNEGAIGRTRNYYRKCVLPPSRTDDIIIGSIESGTWTFTLTNTGKKADVSLTAKVTMYPLSSQKTACNPLDWNQI